METVPFCRYNPEKLVKSSLIAMFAMKRKISHEYVTCSPTTVTLTPTLASEMPIF